MLETIFWTTEEVVAAGSKLYEQKIRPLVETPANIGKMLTLDVETGEYKIGINSIEGAIEHEPLYSSLTSMMEELANQLCNRNTADNNYM